MNCKVPGRRLERRRNSCAREDPARVAQCARCRSARRSRGRRSPLRTPCTNERELALETRQSVTLATTVPREGDGRLLEHPLGRAGLGGPLAGRRAQLQEADEGGERPVGHELGAHRVHGSHVRQYGGNLRPIRLGYSSSRQVIFCSCALRYLILNEHGEALPVTRRLD